MKVLTRSLVALPLLANALGAGASMYADTIVGQVGQNLAGSGSNLLTTNLPSWTFTCTTCSGYGISANGAETVNAGSLGASSSVTVTGTPGADLLVTASSDALFSDTLTITGGTIGTSGVLELTYALDGVISNTGTGPNSSNASLYMTAASNFQSVNEGSGSGGYVEVDGNGTYNDTVTYYIAFTYGTALPTEIDLDASSLFVAGFYGPGDSIPYTASVNYYNTAALTSALVFAGTPSDPGAENAAAVIGSASGLDYGPNGISAVPEPGSGFLLACVIGVLALAKRRGAFRLTLRSRKSSFMSSGGNMNRFSYRLALVSVIAAAIGVTPVYADLSATVEGDVFQASTYPPFLFDTGLQTGSPFSDILAPWSFTCGSCAGYGISANGAANVINGSLGATSSVTVTGAPGSNAYIEADGVANYTDTFTINGGSGSGVLAMAYTLTGDVSGAGAEGSDGYMLMGGSGGYSFNGGPIVISSGSRAMEGNGPQNYPIIFYIPFTYGTAFSIEPQLYTNAIFEASFDTTPDTATVNFYNTATLDSALVYAGTPSSLGAENDAADIVATSGLNYGPDGISSAVPEPGSWILLASALGIVCFLKQRVGRVSSR